MEMVERVKGILLKPKQEWEVIAGETTSIGELYKTYIFILAAIGPIAAVIGMSIVGVSIPFVGSFRVPIVTSIASGIAQYALTLVGVYAMAIVIDALAPTFSGERNINQAFKVAVYSYTPVWLAGIFMIIPTLAILGILGLYGLYLLYLGLPLLMKSPPEKSTGYTATVVIAGIVVSVIIGAVSRAFISYPTPGLNIPGM